ncbi:MAG: hypothetical protein M0Z94_12530, partial [Dehalococcoidales bacterium]|nr:hypothetical protein [Dehalococcoidales bacterium]
MDLDSPRLGEPPRKQRRLPLIIIWLLVLCVGAYLRWSYLDLTEFSIDQQTAVYMGKVIRQGWELPVVGLQSSVGTASGPGEYYLMAIPQFISDAPEVAAAWVGLLGLLAGAILSLVVWRYLDPFTAIGTLALFATGPWAVYFTRKIWTPDTLPFFSAAVFALLALALIGGKRWVLPAALLVLGLELQIHLEALAVLPAIFLVLVVFYRRVRLGELLLGLVLLALTGVPYLWHSVQTGFTDFKMLTSASTQAATIDLRSVELLNSLISGGGYPAGLGVVLPDDSVQWTIPFVGELLVVAMWLGMALATYEAIRQVRKGKLDTGAAVGLMAVLWCVVPLLATLRHSFPLYLRYELFILPIPFVFPALFLVRLGAWLRAGLNRVGFQNTGSPAPAMAIAVPAVLLALAGIGGALNFESVNRITSANGVYVLPGHGPLDAYSAPYIRDSREAMARLETVARPDVDTLVIGPVQRGPLEYLNDSRYRLRFIDAPDMLVLPSTSCQMIFLADSSAVADLALQVGATERTDLHLTWPPDNRKARILEYDPAKLNLKDEFTAVESGQVIPNGLELVAYKVDNNTSKQFDLLTVWRVAREDWAHRFWLYDS